MRQSKFTETQIGEVLNLLEKWEGCILTGLNVWPRSNHIQQGASPWQEYRAERWLRLFGQSLPVHKWRLADDAYAATCRAGR